MSTQFTTPFDNPLYVTASLPCPIAIHPFRSTLAISTKWNTSTQFTTPFA